MAFRQISRRVVISSVVSVVRLVREVSSRSPWCATWIDITWLKCRVSGVAMETQKMGGRAVQWRVQVTKI